MPDLIKKQVLRKLLVLLIPITAVGIMGFEYIWHAQVVGGKQNRSIISLVQNNDALRRVVGEVISADFVRLGSKADFGLFGSEDRGRYRYMVNGTKAHIDVLVTWHAKSRTADVVVDKIESVENWQKEIIWCARPN